MIKRGEASFADTVRKIREKMDANVIGDTISKLRETRNGNVLIKVLGGSDTAETVRREVEKSLELGESVRSLEQRSLVQLTNLNCVTTKEDVGEAVSKELGASIEEIKEHNTRQVFRREQVAVVLVSQEAATRILNKRRICVELVYARIREAQKFT